MQPSQLPLSDDPKSNSDIETPTGKTAPEKCVASIEPENSTTENASARTRISIQEAIYYWVISRR
jgi:hypothetical protein